MRILYFSHSYTSHDHRFLTALTNFGYTVFFLPLTNSVYEHRPLPTNTTPITWPTSLPQTDSFDQLRASIPAFQKIIQDIKPDLIQAGPVQSCGYLTACANFHPFCLVSWGSDILIDANKDPNWRKVTHETLRQADGFLCDCLAVRHKAQSLYPIPNNKILQFPWGIDNHLFSPGPSQLALKQDNNWANSRIILSLRSWEPIYGIDTVLESFLLAYQRIPQLRLLLLGDGSLAPQVDTFIQQNNLDKVVSRPGRIPNTHLPDYYRASDFYLSCSHSDGSSISLLEAMGIGLPPIVTDAPGNQEWVCADKGGWLAPSGNAQAFANCLIDAAQTPKEKRSQMIKHNRQRIENKANWHHNISQLPQFFHQIVGPKDAP